ncbi:MAG TPA: ectoine synthase [Acidimicrobiales bacterium]|jgi:L-ectoine synthase
MIVRSLDDIVDTDRDVRAPTFHSRRLLLAGDGTPFSMHDTVLHAGSSTKMWYRNHLEAVYCIEGRGALHDLETDEIHRIEPGVLYTLDGHERHVLDADTDLRMICVFTPALVGDEVHDADGTYPLLSAAGEGSG